MNRRSTGGFLRPENPWLFLLPLILAYGVLLLFSRSSIALGLFPDPDDAMRLLEVRDWLAGQSWFDVTQYRMNPPEGAPMHWSRLVDIPIAALILLFRPLAGQSGAETIALLTVPLVTLAAVMALVGALARRLMSPAYAFLAVVAAPFSMASLTQLRPLRIDHHGWQLALGLAMTVAVLGDRPRRSGVIAGAAAATWLNVSVEALPFTVAVGLWFGLLWLQDAKAGERLRFYTGTLASIAALLFVLTHASHAWTQRWCDSVSAAYLAALATAGICCLVTVRRTVRPWWMRGAILAGSGLLSGAALWAADPQCLHDPFGSLDPLVRRYWYNLVLEGMPIWRQSLAIALAVVMQPLIGLAGAFLAWSRSEGADRGRWSAYMFLLVASTLASILVLRESGLANLISLAGTAFLAGSVLFRARAICSTLPRILGTVVGLGMMMPAYALPLMLVKPSAKADPERAGAPPVLACVTRSEMETLRQLPAGDIAAPLDISPAILVHTDHRVIASAHHRNRMGMRDLIRFFTLPADQARGIAREREIEYVVACPDLVELSNYAKGSRTGLWAMLAGGRSPAWLEPVTLQGSRALRVWRVKKDRLFETSPSR
jgi:hypothetical protein